VRAWGLRPRGARAVLAMTACPVLPSKYRDFVGTPELEFFEAQYPARTYSCQRFDRILANAAA